jgi:hypothetical protein
MDRQSLTTERRSFLTRLNAGAAAVAALALGGRAVAQVKSAAPAKWEPARHDQDNWMDELPGRHRVVFDTVSGESLGDAILFATNFMTANRSDYGLQNSDLAIIVILRHRSTSFGFNDAMWARYGTQLGSLAGVENPPKTNPRNIGGLSLDSLSKQGPKYAVCSMATRRIAGSIARATSGDADAINAELIANLVPNARMVPAGIVAVNRAQEHGYTLMGA